MHKLTSNRITWGLGSLVAGVVLAVSGSPYARIQLGCRSFSTALTTIRGIHPAHPFLSTTGVGMAST